MSDGGDVLRLLILAQPQLDIIGGQLAAAPECGVVTEQGRSGQFAVSILNFQFKLPNFSRSPSLTCGAEESGLCCRSVFGFGGVTVTALAFRPPLSLRFVLYPHFIFTHDGTANNWSEKIWI